MRNRILALGLGLAMVAGSASAALADTTGGGGADLGLDAISVTGGSATPSTGAVTISGSISCSQDVEVYVYGQLTQVVGRFNTIRGWGQSPTSITCLAADGTAGYQFTISPDNGKFAGGAAVVLVGAEAGACDDFGCSFEDVTYGPASLKLQGGKH
jgi:hypothetical protein